MDINSILINWGISDETVKQIYHSAWQIGDKYVLKIGNNFDRLNRNLSLIKVLAEQNIPVATIVKTVDGADYISKDNTYFFLSKKINGEHITDIYGDNYKELAYLIGEIIAKLHIAFRVCQDRIPCHDNDFYNEITGWVIKSFQDKHITSVPTDILNECISELKIIYPKLARQLIHRDIHPGNMLFQDNILTGYIDFDLSQINARIFDLCYMALNFLIGNTEDLNKTEKWFKMLHNVIDGYSSIIMLTNEEKIAIPTTMIAIEMLFVAYFTNQNNKECADEAAKMLMWLWENKKRINY
jgi:Ser/Thr protein kinase RdoA (MazF antagonist)